jgi:hypothetical protein
MAGRRQSTLEKDPLLMSAATRRWTYETPAIELWDAWVFAEVESELALEAWFSAHPDDKAQAYGSYVAALDREQQAAATLAERLANGAELSPQHGFAGP